MYDKVSHLWWGNWLWSHICVFSCIIFRFVVILSLNFVQLFVIPWTTAHQATLSFTLSWSLLKLMSIESVMPFNHLILCHPLFLLPPIPPSIRVFSNESTLHMMASGYIKFFLRFCERMKDIVVFLKDIWELSFLHISIAACVWGCFRLIY